MLKKLFKICMLECANKIIIFSSAKGPLMCFLSTSPGLTKRWTWTSRMLNGGLRPVDLLNFGGWKPWTLVSKQWTLDVDVKN